MAAKKPVGRRLSRREFSTIGVCAGIVGVASRQSRGALGANERVRLGMIGVGNRGDQLMNAINAHKDAQIATICDVYIPTLNTQRKRSVPLWMHIRISVES